MELLFLKSSVCLAIFLCFYKLFLERESMHIFKRFYLLFALVLSIVIPNITFIEYVDTNTVSEIFSSVNNQEALTVQQNWLEQVMAALWYLYIGGVILYTVRFTLNIRSLILKIKNNPKTKQSSFINVLLNDSITPHTFFKYIFLNKKRHETKQIPREVLIHEQAHAEQKHSIDVILIELFQIFFWFNPLVYILKHSIKLNHEFLADKAVLNHGIDSKNYQKTLLAFSSNALHPQLANAINYSLIKKRFTVMKTKTSKSMTWVKSLLILPLLAILIFSFSNKTSVEKGLTIDKLEIEESQQKATAKQVAEYNKLAKHYNEMASSNTRIKLKDVERLKYIYSLMSAKQRKSAEPFPNFPAPPAPPKEHETVKLGEVSEVPPPPISDNASPKDKKKYEEMVIKHKEARAKYAADRQKERKVAMQERKVKMADRVKERETKLNIIERRNREEKNIMKERESRMAERESIMKERESRMVRKGELSDIPPPPPPPPPLNMEKLAKENAVFYYEGKKVSSKEAIRIYNKNKDLNVQVIDYHSKRPTVKISKEPIRLKK